MRVDKAEQAGDMPCSSVREMVFHIVYVLFLLRVTGREGCRDFIDPLPICLPDA